MTKLNTTPLTAAELASSLNLTGLFLLGVDGAASSYNHATGTSGTIVGTPTYTANSATFGSGVYINTGIAEPLNVTMMCVFSKLGTYREGMYCINGENEHTLTMQVNNFNQRLTFFVAGDRTGFTNEYTNPTTAANEAGKSADHAIAGIGVYPASSQAKLIEPRYKQIEATGTISGSGVRVAYGGTVRIGASPITTNSTTLHAAAITNYAMTDEQIADLFVGMSKLLNERDVYL